MFFSASSSLGDIEVIAGKQQQQQKTKIKNNTKEIDFNRERRLHCTSHISWFIVCFANELHLIMALMALKQFSRLFVPRLQWSVDRNVVHSTTLYVCCLKPFKGRQCQTVRRLFNQIDCCVYSLIRWHAHKFTIIPRNCMFVRNFGKFTCFFALFPLILSAFSFVVLHFIVQTVWCSWLTEFHECDHW